MFLKLKDYHLNNLRKALNYSLHEYGIEQKKIHNYVEELDDEAYSEIFNKINELSFPSKEEQDFLEGEDGKSQENLKETVQ